MKTHSYISVTQSETNDNNTERKCCFQYSCSELGHIWAVACRRWISRLSAWRIFCVITFFFILLINVNNITDFVRVNVFRLNRSNVIADNTYFMEAFNINKHAESLRDVKNEEYSTELKQWSTNAHTWQFMYKTGPDHTVQCGYQYSTRLLNQLGKIPYIWSYDARNITHLTLMEIQGMRYVFNKHPEMEYLIMLDTDTVIDVVRLARAIASCGSPYVYGGLFLEGRWPWKERCDLKDTACLNNIFQDDSMLLPPYGGYMDGPLIIFGRKLVEKLLYLMEKPMVRPAMFFYDDSYFGYVIGTIPEVETCKLGYRNFQQVYSHPNKQTEPERCFYNSLEAPPKSYTIAL